MQEFHELIKNFDFWSNLTEDGKATAKSAHPMVHLPERRAHILDECRREQTGINLHINAYDGLKTLCNELAGSIVIA